METALLFLCSLLVYVASEDISNVNDKDKDKELDPFNYDYKTLRIGGLVFAVVLFTLGILLIVSRRCRCSFNQKPRVPGEEEAQAENLITSKGGDDPFTYDYATLSTGGLVFAGVIVCLAILLLLSKGAAPNTQYNTHHYTQGAASHRN
ncbi:UNVERIFIED_CONTAM: hypothetical protein FKN15_078230 [Acipenser sinensis]